MKASELKYGGFFVINNDKCKGVFALIMHKPFIVTNCLMSVKVFDVRFPMYEENGRSSPQIGSLHEVDENTEVIPLISLYTISLLIDPCYRVGQSDIC